jgi:hypothetical protein
MYSKYIPQFILFFEFSCKHRTKARNYSDAVKILYWFSRNICSTISFEIPCISMFLALYMERLINYIDTKAKCLHINKLAYKGTLRQLFICLMPPPLLCFWLAWPCNFVGSKSGQIQSVKLLQNMVSNMTQHPHPFPATHSMFILVQYFDTGKGGGVEPERRLERQQFTKLDRKYQFAWLYVLSIDSDKHLSQIPLQVNFFTATFFFGVYIVK